MTMHESDERESVGDVLPGEDRLQLTQLGDRLRCLARLAQHTADGTQDGDGAGELAAGLEALVRQMDGLVGADAEDFVFGVTMEQFDTLDRLVCRVWAHGDVVSGSDEAHFDSCTLPLVGDAIYEQAEALHALLGQVEGQLLGRRGDGRSVGEAQAVYEAGPTHAPCLH